MLYRHYDRKGLDTIIATLLLVVIVVVMTVIVYSWSLGVFGAILPTPPTGREILTIENQGFDTTNMKLTLFLRTTKISHPSTSAIVLKPTTFPSFRNRLREARRDRSVVGYQEGIEHD